MSSQSAGTQFRQSPYMVLALSLYLFIAVGSFGEVYLNWLKSKRLARLPKDGFLRMTRYCPWSLKRVMSAWTDGIKGWRTY
ncbi:hypothetical protein N7519_000075 [Penicillium mononematosum]|uniref:uncharacterized protein n=1 Tax=Penicillium mononematosum TaxID=268346 RepID=UPI002548D3D0|nr:uncharacterized protein N7519_000075 [Penicillium mononematosum]KAJ6190054.1 hypothetical protein N7519_000075 [Penicillium mononematosum]